MPVKPSLYDPDLYALVHRGTPGDLNYYVKSLGSAQHVLELGCGYGRVLQRLSAAYPTMHLSGLDIHPGLLAKARDVLPTRVELIEGDMLSFDLGRQFDAVIAPYSTLWCLPDAVAVRSCFGRVKAHLRPGGRFLFDAYSAEAFHDDAEESEEQSFQLADIYTHEKGYRVTESSIWHPEKKGFTVRYIHEPLPPHEADPTLITLIEHRYMRVKDLQSLLFDAGFAQVDIWGGFGLDPWQTDTEHFVGQAIA